MNAPFLQTARLALVLEPTEAVLARIEAMPSAHRGRGYAREFERVGEVVDPEDGLLWRWELPDRRGASA